MTSKSTTKQLLRLAPSRISNKQSSIIPHQNVLYLLLALLVDILLVKSHKCLCDALPDRIDLRRVSSTLDTDPHVHSSKTLSS
ncbi:hypothetical protein OIU84_021437 [Salix udensis]|uniref:Uncharacterized protein n=1 Tax=Salix udensis TaxID=889485 RepID=A0AAD6KUM4_9ROSI|nr:hypothetical protein OIU84_021437 [Salix udensis]